MSSIIVAKSSTFRELFIGVLDEVCRENRVWMPNSDSKYIAGVLSLHLRAPRDLSGLLGHLHHQIPKNSLKRYDHLRKMGDTILYFHAYWGIPSLTGTRAHAQMYYDDAAQIGKRIRESDAPVLEHLAGGLEDYEPVLREANKRLVA